MIKKWYLSKTEWLNILVLATTIVQGLQGTAWIPAEYQVAILATLNILVRLLTNTAISGTPAAKKMI